MHTHSIVHNTNKMGEHDGVTILNSNHSDNSDVIVQGLCMHALFITTSHLPDLLKHTHMQCHYIPVRLEFYAQLTQMSTMTIIYNVHAENQQFKDGKQKINLA